MKTIIKISWRNIWRNRARSIVMIIAIMAGLWGGIFAASLSFGLLSQRFENSIEQQISHVQVHNPDFLTDYKVEYNIEDWDRLKSELESNDEVLAFSGRTIVSGMLGSASLTTGVSIYGVEPDMESATTALKSNIVEGEYFGTKGRNPVLIGKRLADKIKARPGSRIVLTFQRPDNELTAASFRVLGIYQTADVGMDERNVFVLKTDLNEYVGKYNIVNEVGILLNDFENSPSFAENLKKLFPELEIRTWAEISPELSYMHEMASVMLMIILIVILLALAFGLLNTMLMSVFERAKELGMLMAIGMKKKRVFIMIMMETTFLTLTGAFMGMLAGFLTIISFRNFGLDLSAVGGDSLNEFGFDSVVYPDLEPDFYLILTGLVIATALITSVFPAIKALKLQPAQAVKEDA